MASYSFYPRSKMVFEDNIKVVSFPTTIIHKFNGQVSFTENHSNGHNQSISLKLNKQDQATRKLVQNINEIRVILVLNNGKMLLLGCDNGLERDSLNVSSGGSKQEGSNYTLSFSGKELYTAPFIDNLQDAGFLEADETKEYYQFQNLQNFEFQDGTIYNFN